MDNRIIQFGILCEDLSLHRWHLDAARELLAMNETELLCVLNHPGSVRRNATMNRKAGRYLLWRLYRFLIADRIFPTNRKMNKLDEFSRVPVIPVDPDDPAQSREELQRTISGHAADSTLDFLLNLSGTGKGGIDATLTRYGVWKPYYGNVEEYGENPHCFWELAENRNVTEFGLISASGANSSYRVIRRGYLKTQKSSYLLNRRQIYRESARLLRQCCNDIRSGNAGYLKSEPATVNPAEDRPPDNGTLLKVFGRGLANMASEVVINTLYVERWNIGIISEPVASVLSEEKPEPEIRWYPEPKRSYIADPLMVENGEEAYLFFEELDYYSGKGTIAYDRSADGLPAAQWKRVMDHQYHLSYPYVVQYNGGYFCIPETFETNEIAIYEAERFPDLWKKRQVLVDQFPGVDSTVFQHGDHWWMCTSNKDDGVNYKLYVFYSDDLFGPWNPHPLNPVKIDSRSSRSAGNPFRVDGELYRPAQDFSGKRQGGITINRVLELTPERYREEMVRPITPFKKTPYPDKIHTVTGNDRYTVIDSCREEFIGKNPAYAVYSISSILRFAGQTVKQGVLGK